MIHKRHCESCGKDFECRGGCRADFVLAYHKFCYCPACFEKYLPSLKIYYRFRCDVLPLRAIWKLIGIKLRGRYRH